MDGQSDEQTASDPEKDYRYFEGSAPYAPYPPACYIQFWLAQSFNTLLYEFPLTKSYSLLYKGGTKPWTVRN